MDTLFIGAITLLALLLRLWALGDRPLHHDESLHAVYSWYLKGGPNPEYHYDPMMHGPLQFHMIAFLYSIFGSSTFGVRLWSALAGTGLVVAPWLLRAQLGRPTTYALMGILCCSPTTLYFSRFAREDMQVALFTFLMVAALVRFVLDQQAGAPGYYRWLYLLALSFILAYAGKENIYLTVAILAAFIGAALCRELLRGAWWTAPATGLCLIGGGLLTHRLPLAALGALPIVVVLVLQLRAHERAGLLADAIRRTPRRVWCLCLAIITVLFVLLYWPIGDPAAWGFEPGAHLVQTSLDVNGAGQPTAYSYSTDGFIGGLSYWQAQQAVARGNQPWYYYLLVIPLYEWLVVAFGLLGAAYVVLRQRTMIGLLTLWWAAASFLAYGWASEKMPWLGLGEDAMAEPASGAAPRRAGRDRPGVCRHACPPLAALPCDRLCALHRRYHPAQLRYPGLRRRRRPHRVLRLRADCP